jgi:hypothetical protein
MVYNSLMAEQTNPIINQAELLIQEGKKREARLLLVELLKSSPASAAAWWTLGRAVEEDRQVIDCLERVLRYEPGHEQAQARLEQLKNPSMPAPEPSMEETPVESAPVQSDSETPTEVESEPVEWEAPAPTQPVAAVGMPIRESLSSPENPSDEKGEEFDLFSPGAFDKHDGVGAETLAPAEAARPWVEQLVQTLNSAGESEPNAQETGDAPAWAFPEEPSTPPESALAEEKPTRGRMSVVEIILLIVLVLLVLTVGGYFALSLLGII